MSNLTKDSQNSLVNRNPATYEFGLLVDNRWLWASGESLEDTYSQIRQDLTTIYQTTQNLREVDRTVMAFYSLVAAHIQFSHVGQYCHLILDTITGLEYTQLTQNHK